MKEDTSSQGKKINNIPIILLLIFMYVIVAMSDNFKGIFVPLFKEDFKVNNTQISYIFTGGLLAYAVFQYIGGIFIERVGHKKVIALSFIPAMAGLLLLTTYKTYLSLLIGLFSLNIGMAIFNVGVNTLGPILTVASTAVLMNIVNFSYGVSNTVTQAVAGNLLLRGVEWPQFYIFMLGCCGALLIYLLLIKIPYKYNDGAIKVTYKKSDLFKNKMLYLYICALGFYLSSEYAIGNWFVNYMGEGFKLPADERAFYVTLFFGLVTLGRLCGVFIVDRIGIFKSLLISGCLASLFTTTGIVLGQKGLIVFATSGFFYSILYPTCITTVRGVFKEATSYATGLILMCGTLGAMVVNMIIGIANDVIGVYYSYYIIAITIGFSTLAMLFIKKNVESSEKSSH